MKWTTLIIILILIGCIVGISGCTINTSQTPENGKYNTINQTAGDEIIWNTNTCPFCGTANAKIQSQTDKITSNYCLRCGYEFSTIRKY